MRINVNRYPDITDGFDQTVRHKPCPLIRFTHCSSSRPGRMSR